MKKLKNINLSTVNEVMFGLFTLVTILGIYSSERSVLIVIAFLVYAIYNFCSQLQEFVKAYRVNANVNIKRYLHEQGFKEELEE